MRLKVLGFNLGLQPGCTEIGDKLNMDAPTAPGLYYTSRYRFPLIHPSLSLNYLDQGGAKAGG